MTERLDYAALNDTAILQMNAWSRMAIRFGQMPKARLEGAA